MPRSFGVFLCPILGKQVDIQLEKLYNVYILNILYNKNTKGEIIMEGKFKRSIVSVLLLVTFISHVTFSTPKNVEGATRYITRESFVTLVMKELKFEVDEKSSKHPYMDAAIRAGIISKSTFGAKYSYQLTKSDAAVILVNADEYLHGVTVKEELINTIIKERISDIASVSNARRTYIAKAYALGYLKGSSNGVYSRNRSIKAWDKVSTSTAKSLVTMINDKSKRSKITEDGQLIRTTNLPEFSKYYSYILDSFPNEYYDWEFKYMRMKSSGKPLYGTSKWVDLKDYASPKDFIKIGDGKAVWYNYNSRYKVSVKDIYDLCADKWQTNAEKYLNLVFNVNYKTLKNDKDWYKGIMETHWQYGNEDFKEYKRLDSYIEAAINNKTIVESKYIGIDKSSIYMCMDSIYIRAHVQYRILSSENLERVALSPIIFTNYTYPNLDNIKLGEWRDCYLDIQVRSDYESCGIREAIINDYFYNNRVVIK